MFKRRSIDQGDKPVIKTLVLGSEGCDFKYYFNLMNIEIKQFSKSYMDTIGIDAFPFEGPDILYSGWGLFYTKLNDFVRTLLTGAYFQIIILDDPEIQFSDLADIIKFVWQTLNVIPTVLVLILNYSDQQNELLQTLYCSYVDQINQNVSPKIQVFSIIENDPESNTTRFDKALFKYFSSNLYSDKSKFSQLSISNSEQFYQNFIDKL